MLSGDICVASESCSEQKSAEAAMPEEDITVTYTSPDLDNSYRDSDMVPEKVSIPGSICSHFFRKNSQAQLCSQF